MQLPFLNENGCVVVEKDMTRSELERGQEPSPCRRLCVFVLLAAPVESKPLPRKLEALGNSRVTHPRVERGLGESELRYDLQSGDRAWPSLLQTNHNTNRVRPETNLDGTSASCGVK